MLKNITLRRKLFITFVTLTMFIILLSFLAALILFRIEGENTDLYEHPYTITNTIKQVEIDIKDIYNTMIIMTNTTDEETILALEHQVKVLEQSVEDNFVVLEEYYLGDMRDVMILHDYFNTSVMLRQQVISHIKDGDYNLAKSKMGAGDTVKSYMYEKTEEINAFAENKAIEFRTNVENHTRNYFTILMITTVLLIALTGSGYYFMAQDIYPPIENLLETINSHKQGENKNTLILDRKDEIGVVSNTLNDMLDYIKNQQELRELTMRLENIRNQELLRITLRSIGEAVITTDLENNVLSMNTVAEQLTGYSFREAEGMNINRIFHIVHNKTRKQYKNPINKLRLDKDLIKHNTLLVSKTNAEYYIDATITSIMDESNKVFGIVLIFRDITEELEKQMQITFLSEHDSLTKLHNRNYLEAKIIDIHHKKRNNVGIIMGDVNGLKITNDAFGHSYGDKLLQEIADILITSTENNNATIVRWGGDEFVILVEDITEDELYELCNRIDHNTHNYKSTGPVGPNLSIGYAMKSKEDKTLYRTLIRAEDMMYENKLLEKSSNRSKIVQSLENSLFEKSYETEEHANRVADFSELIAKQLDLPVHEINAIILLAKLHDIGKISIDDTILQKPTKLTKDEWRIIKKHPETGYRIASNLNELTHIADGILNHHEHYDGSGYPRGIKGEEIPLVSRIIAIADAYDVITSKRPYSEKLSTQEACAELIRCKETQFDPKLVDIFVEAISKKEEV